VIPAERRQPPKTLIVDSDATLAKVIDGASEITAVEQSGVIAESVPNRTLRIVPKGLLGFWDVLKFVDGISGRFFSRFWLLPSPVHETNGLGTPNP
jgi:hypothetical protein